MSDYVALSQLDNNFILQVQSADQVLWIWLNLLLLFLIYISLFYVIFTLLSFFLVVCVS